MAPSENKNRLSGKMEACAATVSNVLVSVTIVLYNKNIFQHFGYPGAVTLSAIHSVFSFVALSTAAAWGVFSPGRIKTSDLLRQSFIWSLSVSFDLLSLKFNSVGFFQVAKLSMLPFAAMLSYLLYKDRVSTNIVLCLGLLTIGIGVVTVTDVQVNFSGCVYSAIAVLSAVLNQVLAKQVMKDNDLTSTQYTHMLSLPSGIILMIMGPPVDKYSTGVWPFEWLADHWSPGLLFGFGMTSVLGVLVSITAYWTIKATSPVSYQVAGQVKNSLIIFLGFLLFGYPLHTKNMAGILVAISGAAAYVYLKVLEQRANQGKSLLVATRTGSRETLPPGSSTGSACRMHMLESSASPPPSPSSYVDRNHSFERQNNEPQP
ncbi:hypothetical protein CYMTET_33482 [Cymbomonas tetramitiformis]|uniref:Sugar phosphate transporter domain-containing protein n=1 Tax=Cymbomonas tetramitiformis TaxID=36881 RepID=A0AAE0FD36_9CHLO|nr:hypothetical protein CYMTET_33482 [Cymbomonas tetramitiformis]